MHRHRVAERACVSDTDCTPAATSCCDCTNGGTQAAINRRSRVTVEERLEAMCGDHTICVNGSACRSFTAACVQRRCELCDDGTN